MAGSREAGGRVRAAGRYGDGNNVKSGGGKGGTRRGLTAAKATGGNMRRRRRKRPEVIVSAAMSVDGRIATRGGDSGFSSAGDLARVHRLRARVDAVMVGANTLHRDDPMLTVRRARGRNPVRVVLDSRGAVGPDSRIMRTAGRVPTVIAVSGRISDASRRRLGKLDADVVECGTGDRVDVGVLLEWLASARGIRTVLVEGGGTLNWDIVRRGLFDRLVVTVSPRVVGGGTDAVSLVGGKGFATVAGSARLRLDRTRRQGDEIVLYYSKRA